MAFKRKDLMVNLLPHVPPAEGGGGGGGGSGGGGGAGGGGGCFCLSHPLTPLGGCFCLTHPGTLCLCLTHPGTACFCLSHPVTGCVCATHPGSICFTGSIQPCVGGTFPTVWTVCGASGDPGPLQGADPQHLAALKEQLQKHIDAIEQAQKAQKEKGNK